jgi:probable HAF family extracellular repeat protein
MLRRSTWSWLAVALVIGSAGAASATPSYFTDLSALTDNYRNAFPTGISSDRAVSMQGFSAAIPTGYFHTYLYTGGTTIHEFYTGGVSGTVTPVPAPPNGLPPYTYSIDNAGEIGGGATNSTGWHSAFIYSGGTSYALTAPTGIPHPEYGSGDVVGLSPNGAYAVGTWIYGADASPPPIPTNCAAYWRPIGGSWANGGTITDISSVAWGGGTSYISSVALAVNNAGQVVVGHGPLGDVGGQLSVNDCTGFDIFQIGSSTLTSLGNLMFSTLAAVSLTQNAGLQQTINAAGQVVGYELVGGANHAALWQNGHLTDLNTMYASVLPSGFVLNNATAINDNGDIAGYGTDATGRTVQAFLLRAAMPGDANFDGTVNISDLSVVLTSYDKSGMTWAQGDFDGNGIVDISDLSKVLTNYDKTMSATAGVHAVPEPSALLLVVGGLIGLIAYAWRKRT